MKLIFERIENSVEKIVGKLVQAFSPFPTLFLKSFVLRVPKSLDCIEKG